MGYQDFLCPVLYHLRLLREFLDIIPSFFHLVEVMLFLASDESAAITGHNLIAERGVAAFNPLGVPGRLEANLRVELEAQGSQWLKSEL